MKERGVVMNLAVALGRLSRPPQQRELPSGDRLVSFEVTVRQEPGPAETVPVVWPDAPARAVDLDVGDEVVVVGRVRRRFFRAGGATQSRTEVVAEAVVPVGQRKRVSALLAGAHHQLDEVAR
jgi:single-strand DNA-binding protein